jgi:hypothetical protein
MSSHISKLRNIAIIAGADDSLPSLAQKADDHSG